MPNHLSTAISFDVFQWVTPHPTVQIFDGNNCSFFDAKKTAKMFKELSKSMYIPTLQFMLNQDINTFLVITGRFLEMAVAYEPKIITLIQLLNKKGLIEIVTNEYHGAALSSLYNTDWWSEGIKKTQHLVIQYLNITPRYVFLPQLYRGLELEKIIQKTKQYNFLLPRKSKKNFQFQSLLSDFRRFNDNHIHWLKPEDDNICNFEFIHEKYLFEINGNLFQKDINQAIKTFSLAIGFFSSEFEIRRNSRKLRTEREFIRFSEKPTKSNFNTLEKGAIRLMDYGLNLIESHPNVFYKNKENYPILKNFESVHSSTFLFFLSKNLYIEKTGLLFTSPYEAFITLQAIIMQLEFAIQKHIKNKKEP